MPELHDARPDDTVETSLAEELFATAGDDADHDAAAAPALPDEEDYLTDAHGQRSRVTTGMIIALIFALGMLSGVLAGRVLTPAPQPQIIYVLNDAGSSTAPTQATDPSPTRR